LHLVSLSRISGSIKGMPTLLRLHDLPPLLDAAYLTVSPPSTGS
jgi:hypothetical protein